MIHEFGFESTPLSLLFECYLVAALDHLSEKSVESYRSRLVGNRKPMNWLDACDKAGIKTANHVESHTVAVAKRTMKKACHADNTEFGHFDSAFNGAMKWAIAKKFVLISVWDLKTVKQGRKAPPKIEMAPEELIQILRTRRLGGSDFEHKRNRALLLTCLVRAGYRTGKEVLSITENSIDWKDLSVQVRREAGHLQNVPLRHEDMEVLKQWVEVKRQRQRQYLEDGGQPAAEADALFISHSPTHRNGVLTWKMSNATISLALKRICIDHGIEYAPPSVLRRNSCVLSQEAAMAVGYHESYVCVLKDHETKTERDHYSRIVGPEIEFLNRLPSENIAFLERIAAHSVHRFMERPHALRHIACAKTSMDILGRFQLRQMLDEYRRGGLDLDRVPPRPAWANAPVKGIIGMILIALLASIFPWLARTQAGFSKTPNKEDSYESAKRFRPGDGRSSPNRPTPGDHNRRDM